MATDCDVLIIEDDLALQQQLAQLISIWGYQVRAVATGSEGLTAINARQPDIVLLDLMLPDGNGNELISNIHTAAAHLPVLVMTAYASLDHAVSSLKHGAYDFLLKPITAGELEAALKRAAASVRLHRAAEREAQLRHVAAVALTLAHEINNPLACLMGELQLQLESGEPLDQHSLNVCLDCARRITDTVRKLTEVSEVAYERYAGMELLQLEV